MTHVNTTFNDLSAKLVMGVTQKFEVLAMVV